VDRLPKAENRHEGQKEQDGGIGTSGEKGHVKARNRQNVCKAGSTQVFLVAIADRTAVTHKQSDR